MRYQMMQRLLSLGGRYDIRTDADLVAWTARVQLLAWGTTIHVLTGDGRPAARLRRRVVSFPGTWDVARPDAADLVVRRHLRFLGGSLSATDEHGRGYTAEGDFLKREYVIESAGEVIALVSKRFFSLRDRYGIELSRAGDAPEPDDVIPIAIALIVDRAHHEHAN